MKSKGRALRGAGPLSRNRALRRQNNRNKIRGNRKPPPAKVFPRQRNPKAKDNQRSAVRCPISAGLDAIGAYTGKIHAQKRDKQVLQGQGRHHEAARGVESAEPAAAKD